MDKYYIVFDDNGDLKTRLEVNASVPKPLPKNIILVKPEVWARTISENDGRWVIDGSGTIRKIPFQHQQNQDSTRESIERLRALAYSDQITGSDRMFSEASRMKIMGESGHESVLIKAVARYKEIQSKYPWPNK